MRDDLSSLCQILAQQSLLLRAHPMSMEITALPWRSQQHLHHSYRLPARCACTSHSLPPTSRTEETPAGHPHPSPCTQSSVSLLTYPRSPLAPLAPSSHGKAAVVTVQDTNKLWQPLCNADVRALGKQHSCCDSTAGWT